MDNKKNLESLALAHKELVFQHAELIKCSKELTMANKRLVIQNKEKDKRANELLQTNDELKKSQEQQKDHIHSLEKMMFRISHKIRQPVAHMVGLSNLIAGENNVSKELKQLIKFMKQSAHSLDLCTRELSAYIQEKKIDIENDI